MDATVLKANQTKLDVFGPSQSGLGFHGCRALTQSRSVQIVLIREGVFSQELVSHLHVVHLYAGVFANAEVLGKAKPLGYYRVDCNERRAIAANINTTEDSC